MFAVKAITAVILAYLLGSIPMGVIIGKALFGKDIRKYGSGNTGMANAYRTFGPAGGIIILAADILKGAAAAAAGRLLISWSFPSPSPLETAIIALCGLAAVVGASYSVFLKFSGGKSVGASTGVILALYVKILPYLLLLWLLVVVLTRYISAAAVAAAFALPIMAAAFYPGHASIVVATAVGGALVIYRHRDNLARIFAGEERRFALRPKKEEG